MLGWKLEDGRGKLLFGFHLNNLVKFSKIKTLLAVFSHSITSLSHPPSSLLYSPKFFNVLFRLLTVIPR